MEYNQDQEFMELVGQLIEHPRFQKLESITTGELPNLKKVMHGFIPE